MRPRKIFNYLKYEASVAWDKISRWNFGNVLTTEAKTAAFLWTGLLSPFTGHGLVLECSSMFQFSNADIFSMGTARELSRHCFPGVAFPPLQRQMVADRAMARKTLCNYDYTCELSYFFSRYCRHLLDLRGFLSCIDFLSAKRLRGPTQMSCLLIPSAIF